MSAWRGIIVAGIVGVITGVILWPRSSEAAGVVAHDYVGAQRCKTCHVAEFAAWEKSPHARAWDVLDAEAKKNPRCLSCHTMAADDTQLGMAGIQCESCHGPGRHYTPDYVMRDKELSKLLNLVAKPDQSSCQRCHTETSPALQPFDFATKRELIKHWKP